MFKWNRILVALIGVPLLVFIYTNLSFKGLPLLFFSLFVVGVGLNEFYNMVKASGRETYKNFGITMGLLTVVATYLNGIAIEQNLNKYLYTLILCFEKLDISYNLIIVFTVIAILVYRVLKNQIVGTLDSVATTVLGIIYVGIFFSQIINLYFKDYYFYYDEISGVNPNINLILVLQILVWVSDTSAGIIGVAIGRKFFKNGFTEISPKKSVEGAIGSLLFTGIAAVITYSFIMDFEKIQELAIIFILGLMVSLVAQVGDLIESLFKRECGIKDSGTILMGHGGVLDRFDSMLLVLPVASLIFV